MTYLNSGGQVLASAVTGGLNLGFRRGVILFQFRSSLQKENIGENFLPFSLFRRSTCCVEVFSSTGGEVILCRGDF